MKAQLVKSIFWVVSANAIIGNCLPKTIFYCWILFTNPHLIHVRLVIPV